MNRIYGKNIVGSIVALVTPMDSKGNVDLKCLEDLVEWHIEQGSDALVVAGTTGEAATLSFIEHCQVIQTGIKAAANRIPIIAGTGANSTSEALELTKEAALLGADACLLITPYYNKPTQEGLYRHYAHIADQVSIDQILYNVPSRTAVDLLPDTVERLSRLENIIGIKEATGDLARVEEIVNLCGKEFNLYSGDDATAVEMILYGGKGSISVTANVVPNLMREMCEHALAKRAEDAREINKKLMPLHQALFVQSNPIPVKWCLAQMELIDYSIRLPLTELEYEYHATVRAAMRKVLNK